MKRELVARAAGIQIFSPQQLQEQLKTHSDDEAQESSNSEAESEAESDCSESDEEDQQSEEEQQSGQVSNLEPDKKGTEIQLRNVQLKDNASALIFTRLKVVIQVRKTIR